MAIQATNRSYELSTPNKMFEAFAAGVPVVASDFPGFRSIVAENPERAARRAVRAGRRRRRSAAAIRRILELPPDAYAAMAGRCRRAAVERWNWETESAKLVALYRELGPG